MLSTAFTNALINAWAKGEDKAKSVKDVTNSIIRSMVSESMKEDIAPSVKELREKLAEMYKDGSISGDENSIIEAMVAKMAEQLEKQYEWADQFIKEEEEVVDQIEEVKESLTGMTLESFTDSFVSGLSDMSKSWEDMCADFDDSLRESILRGLVESQYKDKIARLHRMWEDAANSKGIDEKEAEQLRNEYMQIVQDLTKQRDEMAEAFGWSSKSNQSPMSGALTTMSQDSIATFEGIGRSIQTHLISTDKNIEEMKESAVIDSRSLAQIAENTSHLGPIRELIEKFDRDGIKVQ